MASPPTSERRSISARMVRRASTEKTGVPDISRRTSAPSRAASKAERMRASTCSCASVSVPGAAVIATSRAMSPEADVHTPSCDDGVRPLVMRSISAGSSPVGSCGKMAFSNSPAEPPNALMEPWMAPRNPSALKRSGVTRGLSR